jgi:hypothetical protein
LHDAGGKSAERAAKVTEGRDQGRIPSKLGVDAGKLLTTFDETLAALAAAPSFGLRGSGWPSTRIHAVSTERLYAATWRAPFGAWASPKRRCSRSSLPKETRP